jgi:translation initiation factor 2B subunit (eIF-2B alpha/beta/delta family)
MGPKDELLASIAELAGDRTSGATVLTNRAMDILDAATAAGLTLHAAGALCRAQPTMASMWTAAIAAIGERVQPGRMQRFRQRQQRGTSALARSAVPALLPSPPRPMRLITLSSSSAVLAVIRGLRAEVDLHVSCGEGRPLYEGREQAAALMTTGASVRLLTDAGLGSAIDDADAVLLGADAVGPQAFINKTGSRMLAAAAQHRGVAVYVLAAGDKLATAALWPHLTIQPRPATEVWDAPAPDVAVENRYFEVVPLDLATAVITDMGVLGVDMVPAACASLDTPETRRSLAELLRAFDLCCPYPPS